MEVKDSGPASHRGSLIPCGGSGVAIIGTIHGKLDGAKLNSDQERKVLDNTQVIDSSIITQPREIEILSDDGSATHSPSRSSSTSPEPLSTSEKNKTLFNSWTR